MLISVWVIMTTFENNSTSYISSSMENLNDSFMKSIWLVLVYGSVHEIMLNKTEHKDIYIYIYTYTNTYIYVHINIYMCVCMYICMCMHTKWLQSCPTLCNPMDCSPPDSSVHGDSLGKNTGVDCHALLQGIFVTQGLSQRLLCLLHW